VKNILFLSLAITTTINANAEDINPSNYNYISSNSQATSEAHTNSTVELPTMSVTANSSDLTDSRLYEGRQVLKQTNARTFPDIVNSDVESSGQATGPQQQSPIIHGFTAYRNILLIDGIRINNGIMRDGPNQYWGTVDPYTVDQTSMYYGQSSMLYGSDSFGSAVNVTTRHRTKFSGNGFNWNGRAVYGYGGASASNIGRLEFEGNYDNKLGFLIGASIKDFDTIRGGEKTGLQPNTAYNEQNVDARVDYYFTPRSELTFVHQHYNSNNAPRTHSTFLANTLFGNDPGQYIYRNYTQDRELTYLKFKSLELPFFDYFSATTSFQHVTEDQFRRKPNEGAFNQGFTDNIAGFNIQAKNDNTLLGSFTYGLDYYHDFIDSYGTKYNPDGSFKESVVQGPVADNSSYDNLSVYISDDLELVRDRVFLSLTSRYNHVAAKSGLIEDAASPTGASKGVDDSWDYVTNGGRLTVSLDSKNHFNWFGGANQGWRAPTIFDLTGDELARSTDVQIPTPGIGPEKFTTYETGFGYKDKHLDAVLTYFNTRLHDIIVRYPTGDTIDGDTVVKGKNGGTGFIHGIAFKANWQLMDDLNFGLQTAWTEGNQSTFNQQTNSFVSEPASRINPLLLAVNLHYYITPNIWAEASGRFVEGQSRLSSRDKADTQRIPPGGSKGYSLVGLRAGWTTPIKGLSLVGAVDNLLNEDYRVLGSGINGYGRNFQATVEYKF
jgi:hemoglobin/transferrin/lactoferrin receptor protein